MAHQSTVEGLITVVLRIVDPVSDAVSLVPVKGCNDREYMVALVPFSLVCVAFWIENDTYSV